MVTFAGAALFIVTFPPTVDMTAGNLAGTQRILLLLCICTIFCGVTQEKRGCVRQERQARAGRDPAGRGDGKPASAR